ncbi:MAG: response regulator transcription factor [Flavobacteriales bacterium]|jgi:DNA-binding NarL/FixJ family response regulator|nr:response regulator transcription factor [Flavobacteriales bacterium]MBK7940840.1 response regulator transcription factor [Flavobacteriales bacterium]MBK8948516.1 response regulator transcription factor [Flavobacteriales bacterium]MBK9700741.1 response regulator transcription factor [Flavobacteriales bacterium]
MDGSRERTVQVLIIEDHAEFRAGLHFFLSNTPGLEVRSAEDAASGLALMEVLAADVVIMDIQMPGTDGIEATRQVRKRWPGVRVLVCTVHEDDERIFNALRAGAHGYLLKRAPIEQVVEAVRQVMDGGAPMTPAVARRVVGSFEDRRLDTGPDALTHRELDVLDAMAAGLCDKEIAVQLGISFNTVRTHIGHIYEKLHVQGRMQAVKVARRWWR